MKIDPNEKKLKYRKVFKEINKQINEEFKDVVPYMGKNRVVWARKKQLVQEKLGLDWKNPEEMNPGIIFD